MVPGSRHEWLNRSRVRGWGNNLEAMRKSRRVRRQLAQAKAMFDPGNPDHAGILTMNVVPEPRDDSTWIEPLILPSVSFTMYSPRPDPLEFSEARKNM